VECVVGRKNVFYTDTDSLIVNQTGFRNLKPFLDNSKLGMLKLEYASKKLILRCPKDYETDFENHIKGITNSAEQIDENTFVQTQWQGLRGAIREGQTNRVVLKPIVKVLKRQYNKGIVTDSGYVEPYSFPLVT